MLKKLVLSALIGLSSLVNGQEYTDLLEQRVSQEPVPSKWDDFFESDSRYIVKVDVPNPDFVLVHYKQVHACIPDMIKDYKSIEPEIIAGTYPDSEDAEKILNKSRMSLDAITKVQREIGYAHVKLASHFDLDTLFTEGYSRQSTAEKNTEVSPEEVRKIYPKYLGLCAGLLYGQKLSNTNLQMTFDDVGMGLGYPYFVAHFDQTKVITADIQELPNDFEISLDNLLYNKDVLTTVRENASLDVMLDTIYAKKDVPVYMPLLFGRFHDFSDNVVEYNTNNSDKIALVEFYGETLLEFDKYLNHMLENNSK